MASITGADGPSAKEDAGQQLLQGKVHALVCTDTAQAGSNLALRQGHVMWFGKAADVCQKIGRVCRLLEDAPGAVFLYYSYKANQDQILAIEVKLEVQRAEARAGAGG